MAATCQLFAHYHDQLAQKVGDLLTDSLKVMLLDSSYSPKTASHVYDTDISAHEVTGTGYSAGGVALSSVVLMFNDASTAATGAASWAGTTAYTVGNLVQSGGYLFKCTTAGTSSGSTPTFNTTLYGTTTDGATLVWTCMGKVISGWQTGTVYAVNDVVRPAIANGYCYRCVTGGTSGGSTPAWQTLVGATITDNGIVWLCIGYGYTTLSAANIAIGSSTITASYAAILDATPSSGARPLLVEVDFGGSQSTSGASFDINWDSHGIVAFDAA